MSIRIAEAADIPAMLAIYAPYVLNTAYSFEYTVPTEEEFSRRFLSYTDQFPWLVWEEEGRVLGYAYAAAPFERAAYGWCAEPSIYLAPEAHGRGIGRQLYALLEEILQRQGYRVLYAIVTSENRGSVAFHEALSYRVQAVFPDCGFKFGRWLGTVWLEKRLKQTGDSPAAPLPWRAVVKIDGKTPKVLDNLPLS